jgi:biotin carboxyl carrier protein
VEEETVTEGPEDFLVAPHVARGHPAILLEWLVEEGERVRRGQPVGHLLDGDGCSTLLAPCEGRLLEFWVDVGAAVGEGQRLARLHRAEERPESSSERPVGGQNPA